MRTGTILVLLGLILLFAYFGWAAFGVLALTFLLFVALAVGLLAFALWRIKRRMRQNLERLTQALAGELRRGPGGMEAERPDPLRDDAIDVEGRVRPPAGPPAAAEPPRTARRPRDGADAPEE